MIRVDLWTRSLIVLLGVAYGIVLPAVAQPVELVELTEATWDEYVPAGKEVDCIYGDYVLRNRHLIAVIARPTPGRKANMTVRNVGAMLIDLTLRDDPNDQLSAYHPNGMPLIVDDSEKIVIRKSGTPIPSRPAVNVSGSSLEWQCSARAASGVDVTIRYSLSENQPFLQVSTQIKNAQRQPVAIELSDFIRADRTFEFGQDDTRNLFWAHDDWFRQAYGVIVEGRTVQAGGSRGSVLKLVRDGTAKLALDPDMEYEVHRKIFAGDSLLAVRGLAARLHEQAGASLNVNLHDPAGPVRHAHVAVYRGDEEYGSARSDRDGSVRCELPAGNYRLVAKVNGRPTVEKQFEIAQEPVVVDVALESCGYVVGNILGIDGEPIPCKVAFHGTRGTPTPDFGPDSGDVAVRNLHYSHNGSFQQELLPGTYEAIVSFGPEYDAVFIDLEVVAGRDTMLNATLRRVVDTRGWVSSDFHSHSTPSGDNTASQLGRVLNLLCENVEFCPCTEHNRIDSYAPLLKMLEVEHRMATCTGMELTGQPLPVNHQNAFPLIYKPRTQDGGGPQIDENPIVQIERLALWDGGSDKLVQQNHPNLVQIFSDRDLDGQGDVGFQAMFGFMDVIEVHPPEGIFEKPQRDERGQLARNPIFHWMQLLNLGYRIPGVVNTDAHYNYHESGWLRNYLKSSTDDPARVDTMEMVRTAEAGHVVMTTGPFMEVAIRKSPDDELLGIAGDEVQVTDGRATLDVKVQCSNWLDVNRVQVFLNGRAAPALNLTRRTNPGAFADGVIKFNRQIPISLEHDTHVIVAAIGEGLQLGRVMGPTWGQKPPVAVSNPIFVDVDGDGFKANGDLLDLPLPEGR